MYSSLKIEGCDGICIGRAINGDLYGSSCYNSLFVVQWKWDRGLLDALRARLGGDHCPFSRKGTSIFTRRCPTSLAVRTESLVQFSSSYLSNHHSTILNITQIVCATLNIKPPVHIRDLTYPINHHSDHCPSASSKHPSASARSFRK